MTSKIWTLQQQQMAAFKRLIILTVNIAAFTFGCRKIFVAIPMARSIQTFPSSTGHNRCALKHHLLAYKKKEKINAFEDSTTCLL